MPRLRQMNSSGSPAGPRGLPSSRLSLSLFFLRPAFLPESLCLLPSLM